MTVRKLSPTGDYEFGQSQLNFISNSPETVAQVVKTSLALWLGEWFLDNAVGMPWLQGVLGKHNQSTADITVQDYIQGVQGVVNIAGYSSTEERDIRRYSATALLNTQYGATPVQIANYNNF